MNSASKSDAITIVEEYIRNRKGWTPQQFRIEEKGREGNYMVYLVIFLPEQNEPRIGGGKTFEAIYDPVVRKVVKEMHFQ